MEPAQEDWAELVGRIEGGDRRALIKLARLISGHLRSMRATDFRDDWPDVVQEVITDVVTTVRKNGIADPATVGALIATITRRRFMDRLRVYYRRSEGKTLEWEDAAPNGLADPAPVSRHVVHEVREALDRLDPQRAAAVTAVYIEGWTYEEAANRIGVPLGSFKRHIREGMDALRRVLQVASREMTTRARER